MSELKDEERGKMIGRLEENLRQQDKFQHEQDYNGSFPKLDSEFHKIMIDSVGRYSLMQMLSDSLLHISRWRNFDVAFDHRVPQLIKEHKAIVEAIRRGNLSMAQERIGIHLETITGIADRAIAKYPNYFKNVGISRLNK